MLLFNVLLISLLLCSETKSSSLCSYRDIPEQPCTVEFLSSVLNAALPIYHANKPFPYVYIDNFFPDDLVQQVAAEFPVYSDGKDNATPGWHKSALYVQNRKMEKLHNYDLPPATQFLISFMQSSIFVAFLSQLTGVSGLMPDPHMYGGACTKPCPVGTCPCIWTITSTIK